jgi:AhpC/TSA family protein/cytochrome c biogenesis DsbD-like protein
VQLERSRDQFVKKGLGVVAISYDSRQILQNFSNRMKIGFPLLSDEGSVVIRSFGILNTTVTRGVLDDGVPYPGIFIVDASGKVTAKYFEEKYQERFTPDTILSKEFGLTGGARFERRTDHLKLTAQVSQDQVRPGNRLSVVANIELPPKMHIYAPGVRGYLPVALLIDKSSDIAVHEMKYPKARIMNLKAIKERVPIYEGRIRIERDFTVSPSIKSERLELKGTLEYQACDDQICYAPMKVPLVFSLEVEQLERQRVPEELRRRPPEE